MTTKRRAERGGKRERPRSSTSWVLGRRNAPFLVEQPERFRPELLLLIDAGAGRMIAIEAVEPRQAAEAAAEWAEPKIVSGVTVRVEEEDLASALRARLGGRADVFVTQTPEIDDAIDSLEEFSDRTRAGRGPRRDWSDDVPGAARAGFYEAAARFERVEPWRFASDGHVLAIEAPSLGWVGAIAAVMGNAGESFGLTLFRSLGDYERFVRLADDPAARRRPGTGVALFAIQLDHPRRLPGGSKQVEEARAHGFVPGASGRYPFILKSTADLVPVPATVDDYRLATACLEAVGRFVEARRALFEAPPKERVSTSSRIAMLAGDVEITVTAPPADLPWQWGAEEPFEGLRRRDREEVLVAFREAREAEGAASQDAEADGWAAEEMLEFKQGRGLSLVDWTAEDVSAFLLEHYPLHGTTAGAEVEELPRRFDSFLSWLSASGRAPAGRLAAARARLAERRAAFLEAARDERRYGPAKLLAVHMQAEGVDVHDEAAVAAFVQRFNERLAKDPTLLPMVGGRRPRWAWDGTGASPDPGAPCPCGSGRRYRRCCMPR